MYISERTKKIPTSPIRKLAPMANAAEKAGRKIYHLNIGQPDIATPDSFFDAVKKFHPAVLEYGKSQGQEGLIKAIQKYYHDWGMDYNLDDIYAVSYTHLTLPTIA